MWFSERAEDEDREMSRAYRSQGGIGWQQGAPVAKMNQNCKFYYPNNLLCAVLRSDVTLRSCRHRRSMMAHHPPPAPAPKLSLPDDFGLMPFQPVGASVSVSPPVAPAVISTGPATCTSSDAETPLPALAFVPDAAFAPPDAVPDASAVAVDPAAVKRHQAELLNLFAQPSPAALVAAPVHHPAVPAVALVQDHSGSVGSATGFGSDTSAYTNAHPHQHPHALVQAQVQAQAQARAPVHVTQQQQQTQAQYPQSSWGVALAKLNAGRIAAAQWEQEVAEKRPEFGKSVDKECRRKETNQKSAKVSRLRIRAYVKELEDVLEVGEASTQNLKREVEQVEDEQNVLAAQIAFLRAQLAETSRAA